MYGLLWHQYHLHFRGSVCVLTRGTGPKHYKLLAPDRVMYRIMKLDRQLNWAPNFKPFYGCGSFLTKGPYASWHPYKTGVLGIRKWSCLCESLGKKKMFYSLTATLSMHVFMCFCFGELWHTTFAHHPLVWPAGSGCPLTLTCTYPLAQPAG